MAYTTIDKPTDYFNTVLYTGNGTTGHAITGVGFQPDWLWIKERSSTSAAFIYDVIRGVNVKITPSTTDADSTVADSMTSFDSDGFTVGNNGATNESGQTVLAWNWLAGGTASSNTDGSITSSVSANTTAGFSIVSYTGTGTGSQTVGHSLGGTPEMIIFKCRETATDWTTFHTSLGGANKNLSLNSNSAAGTDTDFFANTNPTSTVFSVGAASNTNRGSEGMIAYCFRSIKGYSKFGSYVGNLNTDGPFIYTGFKPAFLIVKNIASGPTDWIQADNKRPGYNQNLPLQPNLNNAEGSYTNADFLSNGFKIRNQYGGSNDANTTIYMAFAESPFVSSGGIPTTAR